MNRPSSANQKKQLQRRVEESIKSDVTSKKVRDRPVGRAAPQPRSSIEKKSSSTPYGARNGDLKTPTSAARPSSASNTKSPNPWQRPKVQPASAVVNGKKNEPATRPSSVATAARRVNSAQARNNSAVVSTSGVKPSAVNAKNRTRAVSQAVISNRSSHARRPNESRNRSTASPALKDSVKKSMTNNGKPKTTSNSAVSRKAGGDIGVVMPKIEKTDETLEAKTGNRNKTPGKGDEKLLVPPRRSRAHVMPMLKTSKPQKKGHDFVAHELTDWVNWCDACGSIILSLFGKCVKCKKCMMVCHAKCASTVSLTCEADEFRVASQIDPAWYKTIVEETTDEATLKEYNTIQRILPKCELKKRIDQFNNTVKSTQQMTLQEDGETFRGFIRVTMSLTRPVSVGTEDKEKGNPQRQDSFYVDKGAVKALYLSSNTTSEEVVSALLNKYGIKDNPFKFALFEKQVREEGHIILRKMMTRERPLFLRLLWEGGNSRQHVFILQENESREIQWESFSLPELYTFLKILDKEEDNHITRIKTKYKSRRQDVVKAMDYRKKKEGK